MHLSQSKSEWIKRRDDACSMFCAIFFFEKPLYHLSNRVVCGPLNSKPLPICGQWRAFLACTSPNVPKAPSSSLFSQSLSPSYSRKRKGEIREISLFFSSFFSWKIQQAPMCVQCFFLAFRGGSSVMREEEKIRYWLHFLVCSCYSIGEFVSGERANKINLRLTGGIL